MRTTKAALRLLVVATSLLVGVVGCAIPEPQADAPTSSELSLAPTSYRVDASPALRVTVPALPEQFGDAEASQTVLPPSSVEESSVPPVTTEASVTTSEAAPTTAAAPPTVATTPTTTTTTTTTAAPPPVEPAPVPTPGSGVSVELVDCAGCSVFATRANVQGDLSAALISREGRVALLSVASDGAVRGVISVPYGSSFPAPADGVLACDATAKCVLTAYQPDGTAMMSAFELTASGAWRDISGDGAFPSATSRSGVVQLVAGLGIAVQVSDGTTTAWMVLGWTGEFYTTAGCAPDGPLPTASALDPALCLS